MDELLIVNNLVKEHLKEETEETLLKIIKEREDLNSYKYTIATIIKEYLNNMVKEKFNKFDIELYNVNIEEIQNVINSQISILYSINHKLGFRGNRVDPEIFGYRTSFAQIDYRSKIRNGGEIN